MSGPTAEQVYKTFNKLPAEERAKFFALLAEGSFGTGGFSHEQVFGGLADAGFSSAEAAEYLEVSMSTFRRHVRSGAIAAANEIGRSQLFSPKDLKAFKRSLQAVKGR